MKRMNEGLFHWDLDGVVSLIMMSRGIVFDNVYGAGYQKFDQKIDLIKPGSNVVVADCRLTVEQFTKLKAKANNIVYIDHHPESIDIKETFTNDIVKFETGTSASLLCYNYISERKQLPEPYRLLAMAANHYDLFDKSEPAWFRFGYDLNILFWNYHFYDFLDRFRLGFNGFTSKEKTILRDYKAKLQTDLEDSVYAEIGENKRGLICVPSDNSVQNDVPTFKPGFDVYYIIMKWPKTTTISVRTTGLDLTRHIQKLLINPVIQSAGGHPEASGINFHGQPSDENVIQVINDLQSHIDNAIVYTSEDIPF
jgi:hypothetical protein